MALPKRLSELALMLLKRRYARMNKDSRVDAVGLVATLKKYDYPMSDAVADFELAYGGLQLPEFGAKADWVLSDESFWLFGAHACLSCEAHLEARGGAKERGLVPVAYSPNDVIYFLDETGRGFAQDTIEDVQAVFFAANGRALLTRILLWDELLMLETHEFLGVHGDFLKNQFELLLVKDASAEDLRFLSNGEDIVVEIAAQGQEAARTLVGCQRSDRLKLVQQLLLGAE
jgi:hypothetical protein